MIIDDTNVDTLKITTRLLAKEALRKGYVLELTQNTPTYEGGLVRGEKKGMELFFQSLNTSLTPSFGVFAAEDKYLTHNLLAERGLPVPQTIIISSRESPKIAERFLTEIKQVVVKPVAANHGEGITIGVRDNDELERAISQARQARSLKPGVLVQQLVPGNEYRFLVLNDKVIAVAYRKAASVTGDGKRTISELISEKNKDPRRGRGHTAILTFIDEEKVAGIFGKEFLERVPTNGEDVPVLKTSNLSQGGESVDCTNDASNDIKQLAIEAARASHLGIAGIDIMTTDIENATAENSWIIEVNVSPGIRMHQFPAAGTPRDVAKQLFRAIEMTARPIGKRLVHIGRVENVGLPGLVDGKFKARIDTGATISSLWASDIRVEEDGLHFKLFGPGHPSYSKKEHIFSKYDMRFVRSSNGHEEHRYQIVLPVVIKGKRVRSKLTLADRSAQLYPMLIGRNIIRGKFIVDVLKGTPDKKAEVDRAGMAKSGGGKHE